MAGPLHPLHFWSPQVPYLPLHFTSVHILYTPESPVPTPLTPDNPDSNLLQASNTLSPRGQAPLTP